MAQQAFFKPSAANPVFSCNSTLLAGQLNLNKWAA